MMNDDVKKQVDELIRHFDMHSIDGDRLVTAVNEIDRICRNKDIQQLALIRNMVIAMLTSINIRLVNIIEKRDFE